MVNGMMLGWKEVVGDVAGGDQSRGIKNLDFFGVSKMAVANPD